MDPAASIQRLGFRKWYERELIKCHAALVTCFLCGITVAALVEQAATRTGWGWIATLLVVFSAGVIGWYSWRSYITILQRAERYGERSSCPACQDYGRFKVLATGEEKARGPEASAAGPLESAWLKVQCRKCGTDWRMPE